MIDYNEEKKQKGGKKRQSQKDGHENQYEGLSVQKWWGAGKSRKRGGK